jgi:hypothetical protein
MDIEQLFVPGVIVVMALFMIVLGATAWLTRN